MDTKKAGQTGIKPTANVAVEQNYPIHQRIISDDLAPKMFSGINGFWIKISKNTAIRNYLVRITEKMMPGGWSMFLVRKRYIDTRLLETLKSQNIENIVNLGAGLDTRLYRFQEVKGKNCFEMDQAESVESKRKMMTKAMGKFPEYIKQVPIDFMKENINDKLVANGYQPKLPTFFIWEAVSQYIDQANFDQTFQFFSNSPKGSCVAFTYVLKDFVEGKNLYNQDTLYKLTVMKNLWVSSFTPKGIQEVLKKYGWELIEDVGYDELDVRYVQPTGRKLGVCPIERVVFARKI